MLAESDIIMQMSRRSRDRRSTGHVIVAELDIEEVDSRFVRLVLESVFFLRSALHLQVGAVSALHRYAQCAEP